MALAASLVSCGQEQTTPASKLDISGNVYATAKDFVTGNEISKTVISQTGTDVPAFAWKEGDVIGVIPMDNKTIQSNYEMVQTGTDPKHAVFDGGVWALKDGKSYAAYYPFNEEIARSGDDLEFSFLGQKQTSDNSLEHLGAYDYMYAGSVVCADNVATFQFSHLISLVRLQLTVPAADTFTELTLDAEEDWFAGSASLKLADGTFTAVEAQKSFTLELDNIAVTAGSTLTVWFSTLPTASLKNKDLCVTLSGAKGDMEGGITVAEEWEAGKAYSYSCALSSPTPEGELVAPENDARIELDYATPDATVTFSWTDVADSYSLYIGTDETMEGAGKVADLTDPAMTLKYSDIQAGFIDPATSTLHRYTDNTLYWNVKLPGGSWLAEKANSFTLRGMMIYKDLRNESEGEIVYHVAHVKTANYDAIWMAEDLKTMYSVEGVHFSDIKVEGTDPGYNQFADYGLAWEGKPDWTGDNYRKTDKVIPKYFIDLGTVYYRSTADTPTYLNKDGWCVPTAAEYTALFDAAKAAGQKACVIRDYDRYAPDEYGTATYDYTWDAPKEQWNTWGMNMGPNGIYYYGRMNFAYFHSGQDHSNPTTAYEMFYTIDVSSDPANVGKHIMFWNDDYSICEGWWSDKRSLCPVRMIYKGR